MIMHIRIKLLMYKDQTESRHFIVKEEEKTCSVEHGAKEGIM